MRFYNGRDLHSRLPIPVVTLLLTGACGPSKPSSTSSDTDGTDTQVTSSDAGPPRWPAVPCEAEVCDPGHLCVVQSPFCDVVPEEPDSDTDTDTGPLGMCWTFGFLPDICWPVPQDCYDLDEADIENCLAGHLSFPNDGYDVHCYSLFSYDDGRAVCHDDIFCQEGGNMSYGYCD